MLFLMLFPLPSIGKFYSFLWSSLGAWSGCCDRRDAESPVGERIIPSPLFCPPLLILAGYYPAAAAQPAWLERQTLRAHCRPTVPESAFWWGRQVTCMYIKSDKHWARSENYMLTFRVKFQYSMIRFKGLLEKRFKMNPFCWFRLWLRVKL